MANEKVSAVILQTDKGYYRHALPVTGLTVSLADVVVTQAGKTYNYPRADYVPPPPPAVTPGKPTLTWVQKYPIGTNSKFVIPVGYFVPGGTIGPYLVGINDPSGKYRVNVDTNGIVLRTSETPVGAAADTLTAYVIDGRGKQSDLISFTILKSDQDGAGINTPLSLPAFAPIWNGALRPDAAPLFTVGAFGPSHADTRQDVVSVQGAGGWVGSGGVIYHPGGLPAVGQYPLSVTVTSKASQVATTFNETLSIVPVPPVVSEFYPTATWSTATPFGSESGILCADVPDGAPQFSTTSPLVRIDPTTRKVYTVATPAAGPLSFDYVVTSGGTALSKTFTATLMVKQGTILDPANMSLKLNKLDNSTPGQVVGPLTVKGQTGGKFTILEQSGFNPLAVPGPYGNPARYQVANGVVVTPPDCLLSWQDPACGWNDDVIKVVWTSDDGLTICQQSFTIPVTEPAQTIKLVVGKDVTPHGAAQRVASFHPGIKYWLQFPPAADPDAYTDWTRGDDTRQGIVGPVVIELMEGARVGGKADNTGVNSGVTGGKGHIIASHGDVRIIGTGKINCVHGGSSSDGREAIRKDGNTYGNLSVFDISVEDCEQGIEAGLGHGYVYVQGIKDRRCGGASVGGGLTHGFYIGNMSKFEMVDCYVDGTPWGHLIKSRARQTILRRNKVIDTGAAACCLDLPNGGDVLLEDNLLVKGPFATNPAVINFGAESNGGNWPTNRLVTNRNTVVAAGISYGGNYGPVVAVAHYHIPAALPSTVSGTDNQIWLPPGGQVSADITNYTTPGTTKLDNTTILAVPPPIPALSPLTTRPYRWRMILDGVQEFQGFNGLPVLTDNPFPRLTGPGKVATLTPTGDIVGGADLFAAGWTSNLALDSVYNHNGNPTPWAGADAFVMNGAVLVYKGGLKPGLYFIQPQFRSADGQTTANTRVAVTIT